MDFIEIGQLKKTFGVEGILRVSVRKVFEADFLDTSVIFVAEGGHKVPYFVEEIHSEGELLIKLEDIDAKESATTISGNAVFLRKSDLKKAPLDSLVLLDDFLYLSGFTIKDETVGDIGSIIEVFEMPYQIMALVNYREKEIYIPINEKLITDVNHDQKIITMDLPEGLLNL